MRAQDVAVLLEPRAPHAAPTPVADAITSTPVHDADLIAEVRKLRDDVHHTQSLLRQHAEVTRRSRTGAFTIMCGVVAGLFVYSIVGVVATIIGWGAIMTALVGAAAGAASSAPKDAAARSTAPKTNDAAIEPTDEWGRAFAARLAREREARERAERERAESERREPEPTTPKFTEPPGKPEENRTKPADPTVPR